MPMALCWRTPAMLDGQCTRHARVPGRRTDGHDVLRGGSSHLWPRRTHQLRHPIWFRWTMPHCTPVRSVARASGGKGWRTIGVPPVDIGMARPHRRSWHRRSTQDDQRPLPASGAAVVAQHGVLLSMHLRIQGASGVTIDLARAPSTAEPW